jgi:hypothetical protein
MPDQPSLDVEVNFRANTGAATEATKAIKGVTAAAEEAGNKSAESAKEASKGFKEAGSSARDARELIIGVAEAQQGGVAGFLAMGTAAKAFFGLLKNAVSGNPLGLLLIALASVLGFFGAMAKKSKEATDQIAEDAKKAADAHKAAVDAMEKQAKVDLDKMAKEVADLSSKYDSLISKMDAATAHAKAVADAQKEVQLAQLNQDQDSAVAAAQTRGATPEQIEAIKTQFGAKRSAIETKAAATDLENRGLRAQLDLNAAQKETNEILAKRSELSDKATDAQGKYDAALEKAKRAGDEYQEALKSQASAQSDLDKNSLILNPQAADLVARAVAQDRLKESTAAVGSSDEERKKAIGSAQLAKQARDNANAAFNDNQEKTDPLLEAADRRATAAKGELQDLLPLQAKTLAIKGRTEALGAQGVVKDMTRIINQGKAGDVDQARVVLSTDQATAAIAQNTAKTAAAVEQLIAVINTGSLPTKPGAGNGPGLITKDGQTIAVGAGDDSAVSTAIKKMGDAAVNAVGAANKATQKLQLQADDTRLP